MTIEVLKERLLYLDVLKSGFSNVPRLAELCSIEMSNIVRQIMELEKAQKIRKDS